MPKLESIARLIYVGINLNSSCQPPTGLDYNNKISLSSPAESDKCMCSFPYLESVRYAYLEWFQVRVPGVVSRYAYLE